MEGWVDGVEVGEEGGEVFSVEEGLAVWEGVDGEGLDVGEVEEGVVEFV